MTPQPQADEIQVILADPNMAFCVAARRALEKQGFGVTLAHDGADLLSRFTPDQFDVVLAGVNLRRPTGLDILRHVKKHAPSIPVILLCDEDSVELAEKGISEGAFTYAQTSEDELDELADLIVEAIDSPEDDDKLESSDDENAESGPEEPKRENTRAVPLRLIHQITQAIPAKPLADVLQLIANASCQVLDAGHAVVLLLHATTGFQIVTAYESDHSGDSIREFIERPREGFAQRVANAGKTLIDAMTGPDPDEPPVQFIGTPMFNQKQLIGILVAYDLPQEQLIDLERIAWFEFLAEQGVLAIEFARLKEENEHLVPDDPTTGALKREVFLEMADREFRRSWRYNHSLTSIVVDIDGMSILNLRHGHEFGDVVLREVTNVCRNIIRSVDMLGRYDGDSIALLLLMTGAEGARTVAERLRIGINSIRLGSSHGLVQITATIGVCVYPRNGCASIFDLLAMTQQAQQAARRLGPNQIAYG
ncbi:MAG: diguanylate cyclase [Chloroflexi bacterium]|nr:diguanylate cyclase [Chloroflexota bacterium]